MHCLATWLMRVAGVVAATLAPDVAAIVAGAPPDSPAARVDANTPQSPWRGVVSVTRNGEVFSGVAIGRRHVLTAGHVVDTALPPGNHQVNFNLSAAGPTTIAAARVTRHPSYGGVGVNDLALLQLAGELPIGVVPYARTPSSPPTGTVFTLVGYGDSGTGTTGLTVSRDARVKRAGSNVFDLSPDGLLYYFDFDGPTAATNIVGSTTLGNAAETTLGGGDSGSPAFVAVGGSWAVAGINVLRGSVSGGPTTPGSFGTLGGGMLVAPYQAWIDATLQASGVEDSDTDVPLPLWASVLLGVVMLRAGKRHIDVMAGSPRANSMRQKISDPGSRSARSLAHGIVAGDRTPLAVPRTEDGSSEDRHG